MQTTLQGYQWLLLSFLVVFYIQCCKKVTYLISEIFIRNYIIFSYIIPFCFLTKWISVCHQRETDRNKSWAYETSDNSNKVWNQHKCKVTLLKMRMFSPLFCASVLRFFVQFIFYKSYRAMSAYAKTANGFGFPEIAWNIKFECQTNRIFFVYLTLCQSSYYKHFMAVILWRLFNVFFYI